MFCERGYSRTTFDEIAKKINLTKGAIYWHFRNKPDIIKALIIESFEHNQTAINQKIPEVKTLDDLLRYFIYSAQIVKTTPSFRQCLFFIIYQIEWSEGLSNTLNSSGPIKQIVNYHQDLITQVLKNSCENGEISSTTDIQTTTKILYSMWNGLLHQAIKKDYADDFPSLTEQSFQLIFKSLKLKKDK